MTKVIRNHPRVKASWVVLDKLQGMIAGKEFKPGDKLPPERNLAKSFKVSRLTVRNAIQSLVNIGVLKTIHGSGTFVVEMNDSSVFDHNPLRMIANLNGFSSAEILEARISLEMVIAGLAAERAEGEELADIAEELVEMSTKLDSPEEYFIHDLRFHQKIAAASRNRILIAMLNMLASILFDDPVQNQDESGFKKTIKSRQEIYLAIRNKNPDAARKRMRDHLLNIKAFHMSET